MIAFFSSVLLCSSTVRVIKSYTAGTGKSLFITRVGETLQLLIQKSNLATKQVNSSVDTEVIVTTSMQGTGVDQDVVVRELIPYDKKKKEAFPRIYHFDIASTVRHALLGRQCLHTLSFEKVYVSQKR